MLSRSGTGGGGGDEASGVGHRAEGDATSGSWDTGVDAAASSCCAANASCSAASACSSSGDTAAIGLPQPVHGFDSLLLIATAPFHVLLPATANPSEPGP